MTIRKEINPWTGWRTGRLLTAAALLGGVVLGSCNEGTAPLSDAANAAGGAGGAGGSAAAAKVDSPGLNAHSTATPQFGFVEVLLPEESHLAGRLGKNFRILTITEGESPDLGTFGWVNRGTALKGLIIISTNYAVGAKSCQNLGRFTSSEIVDQTGEEIEFLNDWLVKTTSFTAGVPATLRAALVADRNHDGKYIDAPSVLYDYNSDGVCDAADLRRLGLASPITTVEDWQVNSH